MGTIATMDKRPSIDWHSSAGISNLGTRNDPQGAQAAMKRLIFAALMVTALTVGVGFAFPAYSRTQPVQADSSDKYDGDCQPSDTAGRCADKCPAPTADGAYNQIGTDPATGAAICHFVFTNACPYTEAVSATDPLCAKAEANQAPAVTTPPATTTPVAPATQCGGK